MSKDDLLDQPLSSKRERSRSPDKSTENLSKKVKDSRRPDPNDSHHHGGNRPVFQYYKVVKAPPDEKLGNVHDDPRGEDPTQRITKKASGRGNGRNTESFDPASTLVRPDLRIHIGSNKIAKYNKPLKHDDVVIVPEMFGEEENWDMYYKLVHEMREFQNSNDDNKGSEWISWHEGAHLISKNPKGSPTYQMIVKRLCEYFSIDPDKDVGTRFNWYRDSSDWKPFHHDSAAFNPQRAKRQNITVGASFGATRELAFIRAEEFKTGEKCKIYFPQCNNGVFSFGRDANILWKHGINALPVDEQDGKGRISIILWGLAKEAIDEDGSPPLLGSDGKGPHASGGGNHGSNRGGRGRGHRDGGRRHEDDRWYQHQRGHPHRDDRRWEDDKRREDDRRYGGDRRNDGDRRYDGDRDDRRGAYGPRDRRY